MATSEFYKTWSDETASSEFRDQFPYTLSLGRQLPLEHLPHFLTMHAWKGGILIPESYEVMIRRLLRFHRLDLGSTRGVILTGQPGVGLSPQSSLLPVRQLTDTSILQEKPSS